MRRGYTVGDLNSSRIIIPKNIVMAEEVPLPLNKGERVQKILEPVLKRWQDAESENGISLANTYIPTSTISGQRAEELKTIPHDPWESLDASYSLSSSEGTWNMHASYLTTFHAVGGVSQSSDTQGKGEGSSDSKYLHVQDEEFSNANLAQGNGESSPNSDPEGDGGRYSSDELTSSHIEQNTGIEQERTMTSNFPDLVHTGNKNEATDLERDEEHFISNNNNSQEKRKQLDMPGHHKDPTLDSVVVANQKRLAVPVQQRRRGKYFNGDITTTHQMNNNKIHSQDKTKMKYARYTVDPEGSVMLTNMQSQFSKYNTPYPIIDSMRGHLAYSSHPNHTSGGNPRRSLPDIRTGSISKRAPPLKGVPKESLPESPHQKVGVFKGINPSRSISKRQGPGTLNAANVIPKGLFQQSPHSLKGFHLYTGNSAPLEQNFNHFMSINFRHTSFPNQQVAPVAPIRKKEQNFKLPVLRVGVVQIGATREETNYQKMHGVNEAQQLSPDNSSSDLPKSTDLELTEDSTDTLPLVSESEETKVPPNSVTESVDSLVQLISDEIVEEMDEKRNEDLDTTVHKSQELPPPEYGENSILIAPPDDETLMKTGEFRGMLNINNYFYYNFGRSQ